MPGYVGRQIMKHGLPVAEKGCCCIELKKCCFAQAAFNFLESLVSIGISLSIFLYVQDLIDEYVAPNEENYLNFEENNAKLKALKKAKDMRIVALVTGAATLVLAGNACFLIHAVRKESAKLLNIYMYIGIIAMCVDMICRSWAVRMRSDGHDMIVGILFVRLVQMYFLYVVYSYYKKLKGPPPSEEPAQPAEQPLQSPA